MSACRPGPATTSRWISAWTGPTSSGRSTLTHDQVERQIDLADVNVQTFVNNCSLGLYAKVVQSPQYRDAKIRTAAEMLPDLIGPDADPA